MKSIIFIMFFILASASIVFAGDVWVNDYYRKDGTHVQGHHRSTPDNDRSNNYGPSKNNHDYDGDGIKNKYDRDDDNDGVNDNQDHRQYNNRRW